MFGYRKQKTIEILSVKQYAVSGMTILPTQKMSANQGCETPASHL